MSRRRESTIPPSDRWSFSATWESAFSLVASLTENSSFHSRKSSSLLRSASRLFVSSAPRSIDCLSERKGGFTFAHSPFHCATSRERSRSSEVRAQ